MDEINMGIRIKQMRKKFNLTQEELGNKLGIQKSGIAKYENGRVKNIKRDTIEKMATLFDVSPSWLMGYDVPIESYSNDSVKIPVLGEVAAGIPIFANENYEDFEEISEQLASTGEFFGLKIRGDSMSPRIAEGDTVIVRQQNDADSGDLVIVLINGDSATCKRLLKYNEGISLLSFNPTYEPMDFTNKEIIEKPVKIIGKVIENRQRY